MSSIQRTMHRADTGKNEIDMGDTLVSCGLDCYVHILNQMYVIIYLPR